MRFLSASYNTSVHTTSFYPIIGLTALLNLVAVVEKLQNHPLEEKGTLCQSASSPPPIGQSEIAQLWLRLPLANRHRLMWLLGQLLEHRWAESPTIWEDAHE